MARNPFRRHGGRSEGRGYVCTDPSTPTVSPRTRPQQASRLGCTEIPKTPPQPVTTCTECTASICRYLTKSVCIHAVQRSRSTRPSSLPQGRPRQAAQSHRRTGTVVKDRTSHTTRTKRRTLRAHLRQGPLRAVLRNKDLPYYEYIVYISLVSIYFVIITTLDVIG